MMRIKGNKFRGKQQSVTLTPFDPLEYVTREELFRGALEEIERFGHAEGHGCGYTCATMAQAALASADRSPKGQDGEAGLVADESAVAKPDANN